MQLTSGKVFTTFGHSNFSGLMLLFLLINFFTCIFILLPVNVFADAFSSYL